MDTLFLIYSKLKEIVLFPWFNIADTQVSLLSILGLIVILVIVWRVGTVFEQAIVRIGNNQGKELDPGWYALSRISRYIVWIIGLVIGLGYLGFSMASFAMIGGAIEDELRKRKIEIPFPQRDLHIRSGTIAVNLNKSA